MPCAVAAACATPSLARAQTAPPFDESIDLQLFQYAIGPKSFLTVSDADGGAKGQLTADVVGTYLTHPFTVYNVDSSGDTITTTRTAVVKTLLAVELSGAYGLTDALQIGAALPFIGSMTGDGIDPATAMPASGDLSASGIGDLRLELKYRVLRSSGFALAGLGGLTVPSSRITGKDFTGDELPSGRAALAAQWTSSDSRFTVGADLGVLLRKPRKVYASEVGQQLTFGAAAAVRLTDRFSVIAESFGRTGLGDMTLDASPVEAGGGLRLRVSNAVAIVLGGTAGIVRGIGSPGWRAFASVGWAPDTRDSDRDGIPNASDRCPLVPEDKDDFEDSDGCPDDDNDGDRREDSVDKCPLQAEDLDGFEDEDGCPELDNDKDGVPDTSDKCPTFPEDAKGKFPKDGCPADKRDSDGDGLVDTVDSCPDQEEDVDGFEDWDGCPDPDQDKDGIADADDGCPLCPEDVDGYNDGDGCPDVDNDSDGIPDSADKCPSEAETINGIDDFDGCADSGGAQLARLEGDRLSLDRPIGFDKGGLNRAGQIILDQAALVMLQNHDVTKWLVAVGAKSKAEAERQAGWVRKRLESHGISPDIVDVLATAGTPQVGIVARERAEASSSDAKGVCAAGTAVKPRPAPNAPAPAPADAATTEAPAAPAAVPAAPAAPAKKPAKKK